MSQSREIVAHRKTLAFPD